MGLTEKDRIEKSYKSSLGVQSVINGVSNAVKLVSLESELKYTDCLKSKEVIKKKIETLKNQ